MSDIRNRVGPETVDAETEISMRRHRAVVRYLAGRETSTISNWPGIVLRSTSVKTCRSARGR